MKIVETAGFECAGHPGEDDVPGFIPAEMALLGERVPAQDADRFGLVARTLPDAELAAHVGAVASRTASGPRRALEPTKRALNASTLGELDAALAREKDGQVELLGSADFAEGAMAMLEKRPARSA